LDSAVNAVFDRFEGKTIQMPALLSLCAVELGGDPSNYKSVTSRLHAHVRGLSEAGTLSITKGKGGGVARVCDQPAPETETETETE